MIEKKEDGGATVVAAMLMNVIGIIVFYLIVTLMIDNTKIMDLRNEIYAINDSYLELMMSEGYLTGDDQKNLTAQLQALGVSELDYTGTTLSPVEYGETISLKIAYKITVQTHFITSVFSTDIQENKISAGYFRQATSFH